MSYIDIALIAIIAIGAIIGLIKGCGHTLITAILSIASIIAAVLFAGKVTDWLLAKDFMSKFIFGDASLYTLMHKFLPPALAEMSFDGDFTSLGILGTLVAPMVDKFIAVGGTTAFTATVADVAAVGLTLNIVSVIVALILYWLIRIVANIIKWFIGLFIHGGGKGLLSRLFGFIFGLLKGAVAAAVLLYIATIIPFINAAQPATNMIDTSLISKPLMETINKLGDKAFASEDRFKNALTLAGLAKDPANSENGGTPEDNTDGTSEDNGGGKLENGDIETAPDM